MNRFSISSRTKFRHIATTVVMVAVGLGAWGAPRASAYLAYQSEQLMAAAERVGESDQRQAALNYQMAALLQPFSHTALQRLADYYVRLGQPDDAIATLRRLPLADSGLQIAELQFKSQQYEAAIATLDQLIIEKTGATALIAKSRAQLELGRTAEAIGTAREANSYSLQDSAVLRHLGLTYAVGEQGSELIALMATLKPSEALETLKVVQTNRSTLARVLQATGLPRSARAVLAKQPSLALDDYLLLAHINMDVQDYPAAKAALQQAVTLDPASLTARRLLLATQEKLGDHEGADRELNLINQLESGRI